MCHIVTLSQSQFKEFRQAVCICPSPAPGAGHVTSQQQDTPLALTRKQPRPCRLASARESEHAAAGVSVLQPWHVQRLCSTDSRMMMHICFSMSKQGMTPGAGSDRMA